MLLRKSLIAQAIVLSCSLAFGLQLAQASPPPVAAPVAAHVSVSQSQHEITTALAEFGAPFYLKKLAPLYAEQGMQLMWQDPQAVQQFQQQLAEVALSGVQPQFAQWVKLLADKRLQGLARDVVLSDALLGYLQFTSGVAQNGESWLYQDATYKLAIPPQQAVQQWQYAVKSHAEQAFIQSLVPQHPQYSRMNQALKTLLADTKPWPQLTNKQTLRPGDASAEIPALREILQRAGMMSAENAPAEAEAEVVGDVNAPLVQDDDNADSLVAATPTPADDSNHPVVSPAAASTDTLQTDNTVSTDEQASAEKTVPAGEAIYTPDLVEAVKRFQRWQGLAEDGAIGPRTRAWLNVSPQQRAALLALNIQRLRLLPDDMHNGIMVNIPNYSLNYYVDGKDILSSRVIVGRTDRKTPLMRSALNTVVLNPPWNVPTSLIRRDIVPKVKQNPAYLSQHHYTLLSGWSNDAEVIDPATVDWKSVSANSFPYRIRQAPGPTNSLGRYKFNMPSSDAIYLHDTPNHGLFQRDIRALSSGCVRVNRAADLANLLLQNVGWNNARISGVLKDGNTRFVPIRHRVPVNLYYLTAWVADDGLPQFRTDIYNYDNMSRAGGKILPQASELLL